MLPLPLPPATVSLPDPLNPPGLPRCCAADAVAVEEAVPPFALFSNAARRAEALGRLEAPITAAALPVAALVVATGAVEADAGRS